MMRSSIRRLAGLGSAALCLVLAAAARADSHDVVAAAQRALEDTLRAQCARCRFEVRFDADAHATTALAAAKGWQVKATDRALRRHMGVVVESGDAVPHRTTRLDFLVHATLPAWRLLRPVGPDGPLAESDVAASDEDAIAAPHALVADTVAGLRVRAELPAGHVLRTSDVAPADAILRGDTVEVLYENGAVSLRARGVALGDARAGQTVRIALHRQREAVEGRVDGAHRVVVQP